MFSIKCKNYDYFIIPIGSTIPIDGRISAKDEVDARRKIANRHDYPIAYIGVKLRSITFYGKRRGRHN